MLTMTAMLKAAARLLVVVAAVLALGYAYLVWHNNRAAPPPSRQDIVASWERSVAWLMANREAVLRDRNPMLWWMIGQSAESTGDARLQALFADFQREYDRLYGDIFLQAFFKTQQYWGVNIPASAYAGIADYQQYFLFGLTCGGELAQQPAIIAQHATDFCWKSHPAGPTCVTHQLMGYRFLQRTGCDRVAHLDEKVAVLQRSIERQLTWDPRVVDVYIQRVLMLADSGARDRIKPRWLQRVLQAQLADGSWSNRQPLLALGGGRYLGFDAKLVGVGPVEGSFHATAQGIWLTGLLQHQAAADGLSRN